MTAGGAAPRWSPPCRLTSAPPGGTGDAPRTLAICARLAADRDDMVVKALSWALRELIHWDPNAVRDFLGGHDVAARVRREVAHKLETGRKAPDSCDLPQRLQRPEPLEVRGRDRELRCERDSCRDQAAQPPRRGPPAPDPSGLTPRRVHPAP